MATVTRGENLTARALGVELGHRLAKLRLSRNVTQRRLADDAGIGLRTLRRIEADQPSSSERQRKAVGPPNRCGVLGCRARRWRVPVRSRVRVGGHRGMPGAHAYEQVVETIRGLGLGMAVVEEQYRRAIFNIVARNQDDHMKNIAFLMNRGGTWRLSPAYDVAYALGAFCVRSRR